MLHPKNDRIDFGTQLVAPDGYELTYAVGTTYSLDIEALMLLPVALFYARPLEGRPDEIRYDMLESITKASEKITVFYQNGQLKAPKKYHPLLAYWEKGIQPYSMPHYAASFHPKVWIIRYDSKDDPAIYRLLVTSRNLTFDRSWDIAFSSTGFVTDQPQKINQPLVEFLNHLKASTGRTLGKNFIDDLSYVAFDLPLGFKTFQFWPIGIPISQGSDHKYPNPVFHKKWDELLIVSPFLDDSTLHQISSRCGTKPYLLSTKDALDGINEEILENFECWQFSELFETAEFYETLEEDGIEPCAQSLHAKLFIGKNNEKSFWFMGSANCTAPAQGRNIECITELRAERNKNWEPRSIFKSLTQPKKTDDVNLFVPYDPSVKSDQAVQQKIDSFIRKIKYSLSQSVIKGTASKTPGGTAYDLVIEIDATTLEIPKDFKVTYKPVAETQKKASILCPGIQIADTNFNGYSESFLSPFLEFTILYKNEIFSHFLLTMDIDLPESRLNKIFTSIIDSREKFLSYLAFLLSGEESGIIPNGENDTRKAWNNVNSDLQFNGTPVFEKLMIAASRNPDKLLSVDKLITRIKAESDDTSQSIITPEFEAFWNVFRDYIHHRK